MKRKTVRKPDRRLATGPREKVTLDGLRREDVVNGIDIEIEIDNPSRHLIRALRAESRAAAARKVATS